MGFLQRFWQKISHFGVPDDTSPDEKKLHIAANQLMMVTILLIASMSSSLLIAWVALLKVDYVFYKNYFWGGAAPFSALILAIVIFIYRGKTRRFFGPIILFSYLMTILITAITLIFGGLYGLEYWVLVIMGMGIFVLHKKPLLRRVSVFASLIMFVGLRLWILYYPELLPVPYTPVRMIYYVAMALAIFLIIFLEFRFISQQSARAEDAFIEQRDLADKLLLNVMPESVAAELKAKGKYAPRHYDAVTVLFTDFVGFTKLAASMTPADLVMSLDEMFSEFDQIAKKHGLEKLKTIGDAYMCAAGIPEPAGDHAERAATAALEFRSLVEKRKAAAIAAGRPHWDIRIGLHTGPVVAGIIGHHKFAYDIWGDTVNIASRMESSGEPGTINVSGELARMLAGKFTLRSRGMQSAKGLGEVEMFELVGPG